MKQNSDKWTTVYERQGKDTIIDYVTLDEPVLGQFARITITGWPEEIIRDLLNFTVFLETV